jgi:hypothetical protein
MSIPDILTYAGIHEKHTESDAHAPGTNDGKESNLRPPNLSLVRITVWNPETKRWKNSLNRTPWYLMKPRTGTRMTKRMFHYSTAIGQIGIAEEGNAITNLWFQNERGPRGSLEQETGLLSETHGQVKRSIFLEVAESSLSNWLRQALHSKSGFGNACLA